MSPAGDGGAGDGVAGDTYAYRHGDKGHLGDMHVHAARIAQANPSSIPMEEEGWSSPWPTVATDRWWRMAAGGKYTAHLRLHHDPSTAFCRSCATHHDCLHIDPHQHLYYECQCQQPLWTRVHQCLASLGLCTDHTAAFMLYGTQALSLRPDGEAPTLLRSTRRALSYIRAATVDGSFTTRASSMRPDAPKEHPLVAPTAASKALRVYIRTDWFATTRAHARLAHRVLPPPELARGDRPRNVAAFAATWHRLAGVHRGATLEWLGPLYNGKCAA